MKIKKRNLKVSLSMILVLTILMIPLQSLSAGVFAASDKDGGSSPVGAALSGDGSQGNPYLIQSADDWDTLADSVLAGKTYDNKFFLLKEDITAERGIGSADITSATAPVYAFSGTFDGGGHTLDFIPPADTNANYVAPFSIVKNATIRNLKVTGKITAYNNLSGLVGSTRGTLTIENVLSDVDVTGNFVGGFIGHGSSGDITLRSCAFTGDLNGTTLAGGLICWRGPTQWDSSSTSAVHMENCLFAGTVSGSADFHPIGFTQQTNVTQDFSNMWSTLGGKNNGKSFYNYQYQSASYKSTAATVTSGKSSSRPWMGYYDVIECLPVESTFTDAVNAWIDGSILALLSDVTTNGTITVPSGEHTLDLNGHELKRTGATGSDNSGLVITVGDGVNLTVTGPGKITGGSGFHGGGIHVEGNSSLVLDNCEISGNTGHYGGGLYLKNGTITLKNGTAVKNNSATEGFGGSGIYAEGSGTLILEGGTFTNNEIRNNNQYAVFLAGNANAQISGAPVIYDNKYGSTQKNLYMFQAGDQHSIVRIAGALTDGAKIGVGQTTVTGEITSGWKDKMGDADPSKYFTSDDNNYQVFLNGNGEAEIGVPPAACIISGETTTSYSAISDAVNAWTAGSTLKLLADVTTNGTITVPSGEHTLDLNGYALKAGSAGYSVITVGGGAELTIDDTSDNVGKITGGSVGQNYGGGVTVDGGTLTLKGGAISGNANTYGGIGNCGGGVHVRNSGKFYMEGGEISGNTSYVGGGVCSDASATTVSLTGGIIKNNKTERFGSAIWAGRNSSSIFRVGGNVQIIDNISTWTADKDGEASLNFVNTLLLSGNPTVHGDWKTSGTSAPNSHINLDNDGSGVQRIELEGALTNDTGSPSITMSPIYRWNDLANGQTFVFTKNWNKYMGTAHPADYFKLDDSVSGVTVIRKDGEAAFTGSGDLGDLYITFDANDGEGKMNPQLAKTSSVTLNENTFSRKGWAFSGWNTKKDGSGTAYADKANISLSGDLTLYAQWREPVASIISGETATDYGSLAEAVNAWTAGSTLKLRADITTNSTITVPTGEHTLDLNGHTITRTGATGADNSGLAMTVNNGVNLTVTGPGKITGGKGFHGGGIHVEGNSSLVLDNCEISGNTGHYGGGLYLKNGTITMKNGTVVKENSASEGFGGSGIYAEGSGTLIMDGCTFTQNAIQNNNQYAVFLCGNANIKVSGAPIINNNTYGSAQHNLYMFQAGDQHSYVLINGSLIDGAKIAVGQTTGPGEFTSGWKDQMGSADPSKYFTSDNSDYEVFMNRSGELEIGNNFVPDVSATGFEGSYDGKAHGITVSAPDGATIEYGTAEGSYTLTGSPTYTDAGSYTVYYKVSLDDYTPVSGSAQVKINQINAAVTITGSNGTFDYDGMKHTVSGYTAKADTTLYDVTKDFSFSGNAEVYRTNAGKSMMGLATNMFTNTNGNFKTVTFNITDGYIIVSPIDVTVTITGHTNTVNYDGKAHSADGYDAVASSALYDVTKDFTYNGRAEAVRTDAGTTYMGLTGEKFENKNSNFKTVTFNVTDGYQQINPIDVTVTITGHNSTVNYDGSSHSADGYDAAAGSELYDVTKDFTFSGSANAERTNAGTTAMGLAVNQFENTNANFKTVTFNITDGYIRVNTVDAVITSAPHAKDSLVYNGSSQELVVAGTAEGGTMYYAIGSDSRSAPADSAYKTSVPTGTEVGNYYIWYKVIADSNHNNTSPACVKVTLAEKMWTTVSGKVYDSNNNPVKDATVSLSTGNKTVDTIISGSDGSYYFTAPAGVYNIIVKANGATVTDMVDISDSKTYDLNIVDANTDSLLDVSGTDSEIVVGGLNKEAESIRTSEGIASDKNVTVRMTVTPVSVGSTDAVSAIEEYAAEMNLEYYDFKVEKTIDSTTSYLDSTQTVLEIVIPCSFTNKQEVTVYRADGSGVQTLTESDSKEAGTFRVDANSGLVYIYTNQITTYALGYKPYYSVSSILSLGSFTGAIDVTLTKNGEIIYELKDVSSDKVSFKGVPKGKYSMTITWTDGAENTLTTPFEIK